MNILDQLRRAVESQEAAVRVSAYQFPDETDAEFSKKVQGRLARVAVCLPARECVGINSIVARYGEVTIEGLRIVRRCVDEIDNVWISRAR